ncbi:MAG: hypothetical protein MJZ65_05900 [Paludibacteraceae bacterium]|nr:hypothetical protein [Paludibacteraceae bacterium]
MKKVFMAITLCLVCANFLNAEPLIGTYTMSYFRQSEMRIEASKPESDGSFYFYIQLCGEYESQQVFFSLKSSDALEFVDALRTAREKFIEWKATAEKNNVKGFNKEMPKSFPSMKVAWTSGGDWHFSYAKIYTLDFLVTSEGESVCVISDKAVDRENKYIDNKFYFVLKTIDEFDALIKYVNIAKVTEYFDGQSNTSDLFR